MGSVAYSHQALAIANLTMADSLTASRWADLDRLLLRPGNLVGPGFEPGPEVNPIPSLPHLPVTFQLAVPLPVPQLRTCLFERS